MPRETLSTTNGAFWRRFHSDFTWRFLASHSNLAFLSVTMETWPVEAPLFTRIWSADRSVSAEQSLKNKPGRAREVGTCLCGSCGCQARDSARRRRRRLGWRPYVGSRSGGRDEEPGHSERWKPGHSRASPRIVSASLSLRPPPPPTYYLCFLKNS